MLPRKSRKERKFANTSITSIESSPIKGGTLGRGSFSLREAETNLINFYMSITQKDFTKSKNNATTIRVVQHDRFRNNRYILPPNVSGQSSMVQKEELTNSSRSGFERFFEGGYDHLGDKSIGEKLWAGSNRHLGDVFVGRGLDDERGIHHICDESATERLGKRLRLGASKQLGGRGYSQKGRQAICGMFIERLSKGKQHSIVSTYCKLFLSSKNSGEKSALLGLGG